MSYYIVFSRLEKNEYKGTYEEIYTKIHQRSKTEIGWGKVMVHNLTNDLCKHHSIPITKIYLDYNTINKLGYLPKIHKFGKYKKFYIDIETVEKDSRFVFKYKHPTIFWENYLLSITKEFDK